MKNLVVALALSLAPVTAAAQVISLPGPPEDRITVTGTGFVEATPDQARIWASVRGHELKREDAVARANALARGVRAAIAASVPDEDVQTAALRVNEVWEHINGQRRSKGYEAVISYELTLRNLGVSAELLDGLHAAGANDIQGPQLEFRDSRASARAALAEAIADARARAEVIATGAGVKLGSLILAEEGGSGGGFRPMMARAGMAEMAVSDASVGIDAGTERVSANVTAVFGILQ